MISVIMFITVVLAVISAILLKGGGNKGVGMVNSLAKMPSGLANLRIFDGMNSVDATRYGRLKLTRLC